MTVTARGRSNCTEAEHARLKADPRRWAELRLVGYERCEADETGPAETLELRDCPCGSTLAVSVAAAPRAGRAGLRGRTEHG